MAKQHRISENVARKSKIEDLRRLVIWNDKAYNPNALRDWSDEDRSKLIEYLRCQLIISTSRKTRWS